MIAIVALTHVLTAGPELVPIASVSRVRAMPPTATVVWAKTVEVPVVGEVIVVVHDPVPPEVVHWVGGFGVDVAPLSMVVNVMMVPSGAFTYPAPWPALTLTWAVNVCGSFTRFVPVGVIWMLASTKVLTAGPLFGATPSVVTVNGVGVPSVPVQLALPVI